MALLKKIRENNVAKVGIWYLVGNAFNSAISFLTIPIFTRLLTPSDYGIVGTYLSWVGIVTLFVGLSLGSSIRIAYVDFKNDLERYMSSVLFLSFLNFIILSFLILIISMFLKTDVNIWLIILCLIQSYMSFIVSYVTQQYMMEVKYIKRTLLLALPNFINVTLSIFLLIFIMNDHLYMGRIIPSVISYTLFGTIIFITIMLKGKSLINLGYWKYALRLSVPLIFHGLAISILSQSDRIMITWFNDPSETGIYSLVYSFGMILTVFHAALDGLWIPRFTNKMKENRKNAINQEVILYIDFMLLITVAILFISPELLMLMAPVEYWGGKYIIAPIVISSFIIFLYSLSVNIEYYFKSTKFMATITLIAALVNIILNLCLIPNHGAAGAAYTTLVSYLVSFGLHYWKARKLDKELFDFRIYLKPMVLIILMTSIVYIFMDEAVLRLTFFGIFILIYMIYMYIKHSNTVKRFR